MELPCIPSHRKRHHGDQNGSRRKKVPSKDDDVPANTTDTKKSERSAKAKRRKGERSVNRKDEGFHVVTHVSPKGEPLAPKTARAKFSSQCGIIVREKIPIMVKD